MAGTVQTLQVFAMCDLGVADHMEGHVALDDGRALQRLPQG